MECCTLPSSSRKLCCDFFTVLSASLFMSFCSFIQIPLFFTPVPLVIQNSLAVLIGILLGSKKGALSVLLFLVYGYCNLPVFAGGNFGLMKLLSLCSGGYLVGYWTAAYLSGKIFELYPSLCFLAVLVGHLTILILGTSFLALTVGWGNAFSLGFLPFLVPDLLKTVVLVIALEKNSRN